MPLIGYPDGQPTSRPNQFSTIVGNSTSTGSQAFPFNFNASLMKLVIDVGGPVFLQLNGNAATTVDYKLSSGDLLTDWYDLGVGWAGVTLCQGTSTTLSMRIGAWG